VTARVLLPQCCFLRVQGLKGAQEMNKIPGIVRLNNVGERRHGRAIHAGHENAVEVLIGFAALEAGTSRKVIGTNRVILTVGKRRSRWAVAMPFGSVTFPTFHFLKKFAPMENAFDGYGGFGRNVDRRAGFFGFPTR
jgi:hypothetical protein